MSFSFILAALAACSLDVFDPVVGSKEYDVCRFIRELCQAFDESHGCIGHAVNFPSEAVFFFTSLQF